MVRGVIAAFNGEYKLNSILSSIILSEANFDSKSIRLYYADITLMWTSIIIIEEYTLI